MTTAAANSANNATKRAEIKIYDVIGPDWFGDGITAKRVKEQLDAAGDVDQIDVRINSPGGSVWDGWSIYNLLSQHKASVSVYVDGIALSAASIVAMAGDRIVMAENAMLMMHEVWTVAMGSAADLRKEAEVVDKWSDSAVGIYAARSGQNEKDIRKWMLDETWFTAEEAVAKGFATEITKNKAQPSKAASNLASQLKFKHVPEAAKELLVSLPQSLTRPEFPTMAATVSNQAPTQTTTAGEPAPAVTAPATVNTPVADVKTLTADDVAKAAAEASAKAIADERKRASEIRAMVAMTKLPEAKQRELEAKFVDAGTSTIEAKDELFAAMCAINMPVGESGGSNTPDGDADEDAADKKFKREYAEQRKHYRQFKIPKEEQMTEEEYVQMRRVDEGLDKLQPATTAK